MSTTVRVASRDDLLTVLDLARAFYLEDGFTTSAEDLGHNLRTLAGSAAARVAVVELASGGLGGFAVTKTTFGLENGLIAELEDLYVVPSGRGLGLGDALIEDSAVWARSVGASQLEIVTAPNGRDISRLRAYYAARGFADDGRTLVSRPLA